jgi:cytoskeletal protein CcmA (bactofilin family)
MRMLPFIAGVLFAVLWPLEVRAAVRAGEELVIGADERVPGDLYVAARRARVAGVVEGDLIIAAGQVEVSGLVQGDVLVASGQVTIPGRVEGSIRAATGQFRLSGAVREDVVVASGEVDLAQSATIGRDAMIASGNVRSAAAATRDVLMAAGNVSLDGSVGGDARIRAQQLTLGSELTVDGTLEAVTPRAPEVPPSARIASVQHVPAERDGRWSGKAILLGWIRPSIGFIAFGLLLFWLAPRLTRSAPETLRHQPLKNLGWGALALVAIPAIAILLLVVGGLLGGWWLGVLALTVLGIASLVAFPVVGLWLGQILLRVVRRPTDVFLALVSGVVVLMLAMRVPILGGLVTLAALLFGLGAVLRTAWSLGHARAEPMPKPA